MGRTLVLDAVGFPSKFEEIEVSHPYHITKQHYIEEQIIETLNEYNSKLNVNRIEYDKLKNQFSHLGPSTSSTGIIVEDFEIRRIDIPSYKGSNYSVWQWNNNWFARKIVVYVFLLGPTESGRNTLVTQTIFPTLMDLIGNYIPNSNFTMTNHPMFFINIIYKKITSLSLLKTLSYIVTSGFEYIELFPESLNPEKVPLGIENFIKTYENCSVGATYYSSDFYEVDFNRKELIIKTDKLVVGDYLTYKGSSIIDFVGSKEKFYWAEVLLIFILACKNNYEIDISRLESFYTVNYSSFSNKSDKIKRMGYLIEFMRKLTFK